MYQCRNCPREFRTERGRNTHERAHAAELERLRVRRLIEEGGELRRAFAKQIALMKG